MIEALLIILIIILAWNYTSSWSMFFVTSIVGSVAIIWLADKYSQSSPRSFSSSAYPAVLPPPPPLTM